MSDGECKVNRFFKVITHTPASVPKLAPWFDGFGPSSSVAHRCPDQSQLQVRLDPGAQIMTSEGILTLLSGQ